MLLLEGRTDLVLEVSKELLLPESQRLGVVATDVLDRLDNQCAPRLSGDVVQQLSDRWQIATWEDVVVDETDIKR